MSKNSIDKRKESVQSVKKLFRENWKQMQSTNCKQSNILLKNAEIFSDRQWVMLRRAVV